MQNPGLDFKSEVKDWWSPRVSKGWVTQYIKLHINYIHSSWHKEANDYMRGCLHLLYPMKLKTQDLKWLVQGHTSANGRTRTDTWVFSGESCLLSIIESAGKRSVWKNRPNIFHPKNNLSNLQPQQAVPCPWPLLKRRSWIPSGPCRKFRVMIGGSERQWQSLTRGLLFSRLLQHRAVSTSGKLPRIFNSNWKKEPETKRCKHDPSLSLWPSLGRCEHGCMGSQAWKRSFWISVEKKTHFCLGGA